MQLTRIGTHSLVTVAPDSDAAEIARLMEIRAVGSVVVVQDNRPIGIVTDRDLVLRVVRRGADPSATLARDVMTAPVACVSEQEDARRAAAVMREHRVRRLPVIGLAGELLGMVTFDDLVRHVGRTQSDMADVALPNWEGYDDE